MTMKLSTKCYNFQIQYFIHNLLSLTISAILFSIEAKNTIIYLKKSTIFFNENQ